MSAPLRLDASSFRQALIMKELLDRPLALRRAPRPAQARPAYENKETKETKENQEEIIKPEKE